MLFQLLRKLPLCQWQKWWYLYPLIINPYTHLISYVGIYWLPIPFFWGAPTGQVKLVGGWTTHVKDLRKSNWIISPWIGVKINDILKPPPSKPWNWYKVGPVTSYKWSYGAPINRVEITPLTLVNSYSPTIPTQPWWLQPISTCCAPRATIAEAWRRSRPNPFMYGLYPPKKNAWNPKKWRFGRICFLFSFPKRVTFRFHVPKHLYWPMSCREGIVSEGDKKFCQWSNNENGS